jgi:pilus assembly protein CpaB
MTLNPLRTLFLMLSRTPPAIMLLMIIGVAVLVTVTVTSSESVRDKAFNDTLKDLERKNNAKAKVVYVINDIADGQVITSEALEEKEIELTRTPQDAVTNSTIAIGRTVKYGVSTGQILSTHDLAPQGISLSFESHVKEGMRAVTFAVDANSGVAGFIAPDSHVDILGMAGSGADTRVAPILSDVQVVAVGQMFERQAKNQANPAGSVTVAVSPEDTQKLIKALSASKLYLSLRNGRDHTPVATVDVTALYPRPAKAMSATNSGEQALSNLTPPPLPDFNAGPIASASFNSSSAQPVPPPLHEIEMWTGSKKDVVSVPK